MESELNIALEEKEKSLYTILLGLWNLFAVLLELLLVYLGIKLPYRIYFLNTLAIKNRKGK